MNETLNETQKEGKRKLVVQEAVEEALKEMDWKLVAPDGLLPVNVVSGWEVGLQSGPTSVSNARL